MNSYKRLLSLLLMCTFVACDKGEDTPANPTPTPPPVVAPLTRTQMLAQRTWQADEVYNNSTCTNYHYLKGGSGNTGTNYAQVRLSFNVNGTGSYTDTQGNTFSTTWMFTSADEKNMKLTVNASTPLIYNWSLVEITENSFSSTTAMGTGSNTIFVSARYIPMTPVTVPAPALTRTQILAQTPWIIQEADNLASCTNFHYLRGGSGNTGTNYDQVRITFNANGTGTYRDTQGNSFTTTWQFMSSDETNLKLTVNASAPLIYNWGLVQISTSSFLATSAVNTPGNPVLVTARYVPGP